MINPAIEAAARAMEKESYGLMVSPSALMIADTDRAARAAVIAFLRAYAPGQVVALKLLTDDIRQITNAIADELDASHDA